MYMKMTMITTVFRSAKSTEECRKCEERKTQSIMYASTLANMEKSARYALGGSAVFSQVS